MVDEVFALSPISARAAQPNEADYEAIRDAFMETSRGRWFLGEYAKRNRNADTSMVLDAVARIEHALATQRQQQQDLEQADSKALPEVLAAIRAAIEDAALATASAIDGMALEQNLAPVRKGTRIIKEISWRWREIGADSRICDLIDSQVTSIEAACDQLASADPRVALLAAFEIISTRLKQLDEQQAAASPATDDSAPSAGATAPSAHTVEPAPVAESAVPVERDMTQRPEPAQMEAAHPAPATSMPLVAAVAAIEIASDEATALVVAATVETEAPDTSAVAMAMAANPVAPPQMVAKPSIAEASITEPSTTEPSIAEALVEIEQQAAADIDDPAAAEAQDAAILELVAAEMGAPDPIEEEEFSRARTLGFDIEEPTSVDDDIVASFSEPMPPEPEPAPAPVAAAPVATTTAAPVAQVAPPVETPPPAPTVIRSAPPPAPLPEAIAVETLAAIAAAVAAPPPAPPVQAEAAPSRQVHATAAAAPSTTAFAMPKPAYEPSLGSTLLSNGLLQRPQVPANDPLSPIRRMTQPEKIAFFS
ncbi:hypothetical protein ACQR16_08320 [Bradyrhizobium oligotrophicum]|uniref:hypothetical protein n=1 Tax=Bradyrhizobium oligotrophicum TaxID=44255 RepID=UPI003EB9E14A